MHGKKNYVAQIWSYLVPLKRKFYANENLYIKHGLKMLCLEVVRSQILACDQLFAVCNCPISPISPSFAKETKLRLPNMYLDLILHLEIKFEIKSIIIIVLYA